jgi:dolichol-phosphate mannosyltransferase
MRRRTTALAQLEVQAELTDPTNGFFIACCDAIPDPAWHMPGEGYITLLDMLASSPNRLRFADLPGESQPRIAGQSKLDTAVVGQYLLLIIDKRFRPIVPARILLFATVRMSELLVHFKVLSILRRDLVTNLAVAQAASTTMAMAMMSN